ncbi:MAG: hypothetical protein Q8O53_00230 [Candidatus Moranbacteria bacterium]|nr:hypothetical protein [Candidatus Moranbacteria bacterium]
MTTEFVYSIKKNSSLVSDKVAFALGEEMHITIRIVGGNDEPLREHRVRLQVVSLRGEELISFSGKTDGNGLAHFTVVAGVDFLGDNIVRAIDVTCDVPILFQQTIAFLVYEPTDDKEQRGQATESSISSGQSSSSGLEIQTVVASAHGADVSRNSGTIVTRDSKTTLTRAGP